MTDPAQPPAWGAEVPTPQAPPWDPAAPPRVPWGAGTPGPFPAPHAVTREGTPPGASPMTSGPANGDQAGAAGHAEAVTPGHGPSPEDRWAMACYLGAIFFWLLAPLAIYLAKRDSSIFIRSHAAQAFNLTLTATLFALSGAIVGGLLSLDSPTAAIVVMGPVFLVFWIVVLMYLVRAASSASRDDFYEVPSWLCVTALQ